MKIFLNEAQRATLCWFFDPENTELWPPNEPLEFEDDGGELKVNGAYLHPDGEWATYPFQGEVPNVPDAL